MHKKEFEKWVNSRLDSFAQVLPEKRTPWMEMSVKLRSKNNILGNDYANAYIGNFFISCNLTTRETTIFNTKTKRFATAKCRIGEKFITRVGVAIAWAKYNHEAVPDYENTVLREELKNGDKFLNFSKDRVRTFIGWVPDSVDGLIGKWAIVLNESRNPVKMQIKKEVIIVE